MANNNNNKLAIVGVGCLFLMGLFGLSCMGLGTIGFLYMRTPVTQVAAVTDEPSASTRVDLLSDASFLDVGAGPFAAPVGVAVEPEAEPSEPLRPVIQPTAARPPRAPVVPEPVAPEEPLIEDDQEPIISDEDVQALDAEVQQIEAEKAAEAPTDGKKKKKNR